MHDRMDVLDVKFPRNFSTISCRNFDENSLKIPVGIWRFYGRDVSRCIGFRPARPKKYFIWPFFRQLGKFDTKFRRNFTILRTKTSIRFQNFRGNVWHISDAIYRLGVLSSALIFTLMITLINWVFPARGVWLQLTNWPDFTWYTLIPRIHSEKTRWNFELRTIVDGTYGGKVDCGKR